MAMPKCKEREAAIVNGDNTYFTGKPCKYGHVVPRNTVDFSCTECRRQMRLAKKEYHREYARRRRQEMLARDPEGTRAKWSAYNRERRRRDPESVRAYERQKSARFRRWNPQAKLAETRRYQAAKLRRTPRWADLEAIRRFYENCPPGHHVDHVIPLRGKRVSGLHVENNLQYLKPKANRVKGHRYEVN